MAAAVPVIVGGVSLSLSSLAGVWILTGGGGVIVGGAIVGGVWFRCQQREGRRVSSFEMGARASAWFLSSLAVPDIAATMAGRWRALDSQTGSREPQPGTPVRIVPAETHGRAWA